MEKETICGIYKITNKDNGKVYVGQSIDIRRRFLTHKSELARGGHHNIVLQNSYNIHGIDAFDFEIIEECDEDSLNEREMFWISELNSMVPNGYNLTIGGEGGNGLTWDRDDCRAVSRDVICLSTMEMYESARDASEDTGIPAYSIIGCCAGRSTYCGKTNDEFTVWAFTDEFESAEDKWGFISERLEKAREAMDPVLPFCREVICLNTMQRFKSAQAASDATGVKSNGILECCSGKYARAGMADDIGLVWAYASEFDCVEDQASYIDERMQAMYDSIAHKKTRERGSKSVVCLNNGKRFSSITDAAEWAGISPSNLSTAVTGGSLSAGTDDDGNRLVWRYSNIYDNMNCDDVAMAILEADRSAPDYYGYLTKEVVCLNTLQVFESVKEASLFSGTNAPAVSNCCNGTHRSSGVDKETGMRLVFRHKEDFDKMTQEDIERAICDGNSSRAKKRVRCITTGEVFLSIEEAARRYNAKGANISAVCRGRVKHAGKLPGTKIGLKWEYIA